MENKTQSEIEKRIEESAFEYSKMAWRREPYCVLSVEDMFKAGAKFILEMPELRELRNDLVYIHNLLLDYYSEPEVYGDSPNLAFKKSQQALSKLRELGVV